MGKRVLRENFQPQTCSGKRAKKTVQGKGNLKNTVFIDVDSYQGDDVIIIDLSEFGPQFHGSSVPSRDRTYTPQRVISIDDDDDDADDESGDDDESDAATHRGIISEGVGDLDSDASSSIKLSPAPSCMQNSVHVDVDDGHVNEKDSTKDTGRNRYGLDGSESESPESDCSDCELMDREQWEKVLFERKHHVFNDQSCYDEHASSSGVHSNIYADVEVENMNEQHAGNPVYSGPSNGEYVKENQSSFSVKGDGQVDDINFNLGTENSFKDSDQQVRQDSFKSPGSESIEEMQSLRQGCDIEHGERTRGEELDGKESECIGMSQEVRERLVLHAQDGNLTASNERDIINKREKLKETDEYKQTIEAEWASRQKQLQIQAEEAQRLRKRRRAENERLLDMQRRQKKRIEEVRETQKKDEEFMNMKEKLRIEIQKGLNELERQCHDMTSLLRGLGIPVGGSLIPLPNEVHAAYKRALLKFHPDRASKTDIQQQVEAEEKFKLISRMKEKFLLTSCH
ncbi:uncharacterized protein LOC133284264 isoform X2 [Gastrolobium bilobum]|uniref:uncharacterized protein LOC133284264 isoform X2 n=1 Tax=Gastrolobium bilobum TaxID=150636 RepID=UPI002AB25450|nr:uncharacterized protein LOC133284264 isoform X2 [Gastrolobium bilobum]